MVASDKFYAFTLTLSILAVVMADDIITLQRGSATHDVQPEQVTTDILRRLFGVSKL